MTSVQSFAVPAMNPDACARCGKGIEDPSNAIQVDDSREIGGYAIPVSELVCLSCWHNPGGPRPADPKPARTLPYKTLAEANARAEKIAQAFGRPLPDVWGNADIGYRVFGDTPAVAGGYKPLA
jgi:hypothetical protein